MEKETIYSKSFAFAIRVVNLKKFLNSEKKEYDLSRQILRSGTSIGANAAEAQQAQSKADFISKMSIALKEANETRFWIRLLHSTEYLTDEQAFSLIGDCEELIRMLVSIVKNSKNK